MANSSTENPIYICHLCSKEFLNRAKLIAHLCQCQIKYSTKKLNEIIHPLPKLNQIQLDILYSLKLHPINKQQYSSNNLSKINDINLQIPLSNLYSQGFISCSKQSSFDDSCCDFDNSSQITFITDESLNLNNKLPSYHIYKYSQRERKHYYSRLKHNRLKKQLISPTIIHKKSRLNPQLSPIFSSKTFLINIPTKIYSRQRISTNSNDDLYPLIFSSNFHTLVQLSLHDLLNKYFIEIQFYYYLLHSIASQEFQLIIQNYDQQHDYSYTSITCLNILRQTMLDYTSHFHHTYKRNNSLDNDDEQSNHELVIPPLKIRRYDDSSYEIDKRSTSSSSSGMSITQIHNGYTYDDQQNRRRCFDTRTKKFPSKISDIQLNSNSNDIHDITVGSPLQNDLSFTDYQQSKDRTSTKLSYTSDQKPIIQVKEQSNDTQPKYQSVVLNEGARIRIVNCSNDSNNKQISSRNSTKNLSNSFDKLDENWATKSTRHNTRKHSSTNSKTSDILDSNPSYQAQPVLLSSNEITNRWLKHNVFYRCHACSHEEFFVNLSRECMRLHVSSKHGNMEENFKQRISNFLNNQGRALKIFQHYLKWQQPWSENDIDRIFQLSNTNNNGAS